VRGGRFSGDSRAAAAGFICCGAGGSDAAPV